MLFSLGETGGIFFIGIVEVFDDHYTILGDKSV
jgi:hypothetical protein